MLIVTYELTDDIGVEHEVEFDTEQAAADFIKTQTDYFVWWLVEDENGNEVACSFPF